ncbi:hypothetical protein [Sulfuriflexus sp.]|uniref:hypothetical protein n=1 Tax=Sulfuriflexus sp. TaxID=2015443 RepID=UPI0028CD1E20|nr:hypothetical protein [Sulfuriflexus sp.]MDT8403631.1 hypothetical protein [Sulfuriflexus sp.]
MSLQDDNPQGHNSPPESLEQVLSSLQNILEHKRFPFAEEGSNHGPAAEALPEPFSEQPAELYDDPLYLDEDSSPPLPAEDTVEDEMQIPVLDDVIFRDLPAAASQGNEIEALLLQLRSELDVIVDDIVDEARQQFESGDSPVPAENSLQRFLRELGQRNPD